MPIYKICDSTITEVKATSFNAINTKEQDIQKLLLHSIDAIDDNILVIGTEFGDFEDSRRRIDILGIDDKANIVVVELKRTEDGGHMELQAIRYAAMVSTMTYTKALDTYKNHLKSLGNSGDPESLLLSFLGWDTPKPDEFGKDVRIVLVSAEFSKEITSSILWLYNHGIDARCIRMKPYQIEQALYLDIEQVIPLPETADYQIRLREKEVEQRQARQDSTKDFTRFDLTLGDQLHTNIPKRKLIYLIVKYAIENNIHPEELRPHLPGSNRWLKVDNICSEADFIERAKALRTPYGKEYDLKRYFCADSDLFKIDNKTYALNNQWGTNTIPTIQSILVAFPDLNIKYTEVD